MVWFIAFLHWPSANSSFVTLGDIALHHGTFGNSPNSPFYRQLDFLLQGLAHWNIEIKAIRRLAQWFRLSSGLLFFVLSVALFFFVQ
ncbi:hypothetical protein H5410_040779 [Solanum commersonii]|uniref:Uncharacterized protein n=1 Tax=Solanum commersonii TaxID=4109 RepID=A0A9J5XPY0_SOLCO|nr:hypothetical protein H5410_040779 [Solanum commersonii]